MVHNTHNTFIYFQQQKVSNQIKLDFSALGGFVVCCGCKCSLFAANTAKRERDVAEVETMRKGQVKASKTFNLCNCSTEERRLPVAAALRALSSRRPSQLKVVKMSTSPPDLLVPTAACYAKLFNLTNSPEKLLL